MRQGNSVVWTCVLGVAAALGLGCPVSDPRFCDESTPCELAAEFPYCDLTGQHPASEGVGKTCIPYPWDAAPASADASVPDALAGAISVALTGAGSGAVTSAPAGIDCPGTCSASFSMGTNVVLTAVPGGDSEFIGWSGGCSGTGDCQVAGGATASVAAEFGIREYALSVSLTSDGTGTVTSNPAGIDCGSDCEHDYPHGTMVTLTASADAQSAFAGWSGACTGDAGCTVTMDAAKTVSAAFDALPQCHPASRTTDCASGESCYVIIATGLGTCQAPAGGLLTTGTECNSAAPGTQGCDCQFLNGCDIGYGCLLNNDPMNATGLVCAYFCDPLPGGTGPQCGDSIVGGSDVDGPGANYSCRQIQTFYSNGMNVPADIGMCINPVTYPTCAGCTDESQPGCDPDMFPCCDDGTVTPTDPSDDCP